MLTELSTGMMSPSDLPCPKQGMGGFAYPGRCPIGCGRSSHMQLTRIGRLLVWLRNLDARRRVRP